MAVKIMDNISKTGIICPKCSSHMYFAHFRYPSVIFEPQYFLEDDTEDLCIYGCLACEHLISVSGNELSDKERKLSNNMKKMTAQQLT
jgi:hypothetical protein